MKIQIKRLDKLSPLPEYKTKGSVGFDFYSTIDAVIQPNEIKMIPTGIIIKVPNGYFLMITARSSLSVKKGLMLANGVGTVDQDYCGENDEIHLLVRNISDKPTSAQKGERLANGIFVKIETADWIEVEKMDSESRGGFGSTGI